MASLLIGMLLSGCRDTEPTLNERADRARKIASPVARGNELVRVAYNQYEAGDKFGALNSLSAATKASDDILDAASRARVLNYVAVAMGKFKEPRRAKEVAQKVERAIFDIDKAESKIPVMAKLAEVNARFLDRSSKAEELLKQCEEQAATINLESSRFRSFMLIAASYKLLKMQPQWDALLARAEKNANDLQDARRRTDSLIEVARGLSDMQQKERADRTFQLAQTAAATIADANSRAHAKLAIVEALKQCNRAEEAAKVLSAVKRDIKQVGDAGLKKQLTQQLEKLR